MLFRSIYNEQCLLSQKFVKNPDISIKDYVSQAVATIGENISIARFSRYVLGETAKKAAAQENA